jgi:hypothetical protein
VIGQLSEGRAAPRAVPSLILAYAAALDAASEPSVRRGAAKRLGVGVERQTIEYVRRSLDALTRRYRLRAALADDDHTADNADARRVELLAESLPPRPSRLQQVLPYVLMLVIAQLLLASPIPQWLLTWAPSGTSEGPGGAREDTSALTAALSELTKLDVSSAGEVADLLLHRSALAVCLVLVFVCLAGYLVQRPLATGYVHARRLLREHKVFELEDRAFGTLEATPPRSRRPDLLAPALLGAAALLVSAGTLPGYVDGLVNTYSSGGASLDDAISAVAEISRSRAYLLLATAAATLGVMRLAWLAHREREKKGVIWLATTVGGLAAIAGLFLAYAAADTTAPGVQVDLPRGFSTVRAGSHALRVTVSCDEVCDLAEARVMNGSVDGGSAGGLEVTARRQLPAKPPPESFNSSLRLRWAVSLRLSDAQLALLQEGLRRSNTDEAFGYGLEFTVLDRHGNRSDAPAFIF